MWGRGFDAKKVQKELHEEWAKQWGSIGPEGRYWAPIMVTSFALLLGEWVVSKQLLPQALTSYFTALSPSKLHTVDGHLLFLISLLWGSVLSWPSGKEEVGGISHNKNIWLSFSICVHMVFRHNCQYFRQKKKLKRKLKSLKPIFATPLVFLQTCY